MESLTGFKFFHRFSWHPYILMKSFMCYWKRCFLWDPKDSNEIVRILYFVFSLHAKGFHYILMILIKSLWFPCNRKHFNGIICKDFNAILWIFNEILCISMKYFGFSWNSKDSYGILRISMEYFGCV